MRRKPLIITLAASILATFVVVASAAIACQTVPDRKVAVCKYVGKPGVNEVLKSGENPIVVSINALVGPNGTMPTLGQSFSDAQGRSVVVALPGMALPEQGSCPAPVTPQQVTPAGPTTTPATCSSGETLAMPDDSVGIVYSENGSLTGPGSVTITATARDGYTLAPTEGWQLSEDGLVATLDVYLNGPRTDGCTIPTAALTSPTITPATCLSGEVLAMPSDTDRVVYTETGALTGPGSVVITATASEGYMLVASGGWQLAEGSHQATLTVDLAGPRTDGCSTPIGVLATPVITKATCTHAQVLTMPADTNDITYAEAGSLTGPGTVVITATASDGYQLAATGDWQVAQGAHTATLTVHLTGKLTTSCGADNGNKGKTAHHRRHHSAPPTTGSPLPGTAFTL
jgi:hypothetical protein